MLEGSESWFNVNLLHLNVTNIEEIVFTLDVLYQDNKSFKFLGMKMDQKLNWYDHINYKRPV